MKKVALLVLLTLCINAHAQEYGFKKTVEKQKLLLDLELLYQGLTKYHTGMYWYTSEEEVEKAFKDVRQRITRDLHVLEYYKLIAPLVGLSREDHTNIFLSQETLSQVNKEATFLPFKVIFLGEDMYCLQNGSSVVSNIVGKKILSINGETPKEIASKIGSLFPSDGFIERVKYHDLKGFGFAKYYYYYYGSFPKHNVQLENQNLELTSLNITALNENYTRRYKVEKTEEKDCLEFKIINDSTAYLGLHDFDNDEISENKIHNNMRKFLEHSFREIKDKAIENLILDLSKNTGGSEGNGSMVYSYIGPNFQKYIEVKAKAQKAILDNGVDQPIKLKTFGFFEKLFYNTRQSDGSYIRKKNAGVGLMAYKKEPKNKFKGQIYVLIGPATYSGGSELANMIYSNELGTFIGEETGGGYYGNTSGYEQRLTLPHSRISIDIPSLHFKMNVNETIPFGRGVIPHHEVYPSFEQYTNGSNALLQYALDLIKND